MKIGIEIQRLFRKERYGIETSALELIHELHRQNTPHQFIVFVKKGSNTKLFESNNFNIRKVAGRFFIDFEQLFLPLAAQQENVDILHCTGNTTPLFCTKPIVQTLHDIIFMDPIPSHDTPYQRLGNYYRRLIVPTASRKSEIMITVSNYEKAKIIERLGIDDRKIHVIYNGINARFRKIENPNELLRIREKYKLPHEYILFLGNSSERKNPGRVLDAYLSYAMQTENPLPLVTPGLSHEYILRHLKDANALKYKEQICSPGYIDLDDLPHLYTLSEIFLFPSLAEGFGMPLLEAMACGVPVITSNASSLPEIAGNAAELVDPFNIDSIRNAIQKLTLDKTLRQEYSEKGLKHVTQFQWSKAAEKTMEVYERAFNKASTQKAKMHEVPTA